MSEKNLASFKEVKKFVRSWKKYQRRPVVVRAVRMPCLFGFTCENSEWISGRAGDWLIEEADGRLAVVKHAKFITNFHPVRKKK